MIGFFLVKIIFQKTVKIRCTKKIKLFKERYENLKGRKLIKHVYKNYPYYAINSVIASDILNEDELQVVKGNLKRRRKKVFATIGYEGITLETYINKLIRNDIRVLVDVRKNPISRKYGFSKNTLKEVLFKVGIDYMHFPELGIDSSKRSKLNTYKDYECLFDDYEKSVLKKNRKVIDDLYEIFDSRKRIAVTCFEESHTMCHRGRVAKHIKMHDENVEILHL